jgi:hypothetical protein
MYELLLGHISFKIAFEIISMKISKETDIEFKEIRTEIVTIIDEVLGNQLVNIIKKMSNHIYKKLSLGKNWKETYIEMLQIIRFVKKREIICLELLFDHCFQRDIIDGTVSIEGKKFVHANHNFVASMFAEIDKCVIPSAENYIIIF